MFIKIRLWIPIAITITFFCGLLYAAVQQNYRQSANDPQIQLSEDIAEKLLSGQTYAHLIYPDQVDISKSLSTFIIVYDGEGKVLFSNVTLDGQTPQVPRGVLETA